MAQYSFRFLKNLFGTRYFPITHLEAVRDNDNNNLDTILTTKEKVISTALTDLDDRVSTLEERIDSLQTLLSTTSDN